MKRGVLVGGVLVLSSIRSLPAQVVAPSFEAASVRPTAESFLSRIDHRPGRFRAIRAHVRMLLAFAYDIPDYRIEGGPGWTTTERFDIVATVPDGATVDDRRAMLRTLLAERFRLVAHEQTTDGPVYELVMASDDGHPGPGLTRPDESVDCEQVEAARSAQAAEFFRHFRESPSLLRDGPTCGRSQADRPTPGGGTHSAWQAGRQTVSALADYLSPRVRRPVIDRTGLAGEFDVRLEYLEPELTPTGRGADFPEPVDVPPLFVALEEQLGLKLEEARGPVTVLVIDEVQRPDPN